MNNDLISRREAEELGATCLARRNENGQLEAIISLDNVPPVETDIEDAYKQGYTDGWKERFGEPERLQGNCENCDFRKFSEKFVDGVVEVMNKNGITSVEQLSEILKGSTE